MKHETVRNSLLFGLLAALLAAYVVPRLEWVEETKRIGAHGEAADDPDYGARLLISKLGYHTAKVDDPTKLGDLPDNATLHLGALIAEPLAARLEPTIINWVQRGGHLVVAVAGPEQSDRFTHSLGMHRLGRHLSSKDEPIEIEGRTLSVRLSNCDVFALDAKPLWSATVPSYRPYSGSQENEDDEEPEDADTSDETDASDEADAPDMEAPSGHTRREIAHPAIAVARWQFGKGLVTAMCDDRPFSNDGIGRVDHAEFVTRLLLDGRGGPVYFAPQTDYPSLPLWLLGHAPEAVGGAVLLVMLALWRTIPRAGAIRREPPPQRPGLGTHLSAIGHFHLGRSDWLTLLTALRDEVRRLAQQGGSQFDIAELAARTGVSTVNLETAMADTPVRERREFVRTATLLSDVIDILQAHRTAPHRSVKNR